jgi:hypothetical protein
VGVRAELPEFVTHYYLAGRRPFLSLSELSDAELAEVLADLRTLRQAGKQHRPFGPRYIDLRRRTEARMRELFAAAGGNPERPAPHYFVLGDSPWFAGLAKNMNRVQLPLSALPPRQTSITYPDSLTAMELGTEFGLSQQPRPYHGRVFLLSDLQGLVAVRSPRSIELGRPARNVDHLARRCLHRSPALERRAHQGLPALISAAATASVPVSGG